MQALRRLGVTQDALECCPEISPILDRALSAEKSARTSTARVISFLRYSEDENAARVIAIYDNANKGERDTLPIEALCIKAKVNPLVILGAAIMCARRVSAQESALTAIIEHPDVVKATIDYAKALPGAVEDRKMIHQAIGFLPTSKGGSVNVNLFGGNPQFSKDEDEGGDDDDAAFKAAFGSTPGELETWGDNRRKMLEKGR